MAKSYKWTPDQEQRNKQSAKRTKLSKQEQGRIEKALLRQGVEL